MSVSHRRHNCLQTIIVTKVNTCTKGRVPLCGIFPRNIPDLPLSVVRNKTVLVSYIISKISEQDHNYRGRRELEISFCCSNIAALCRRRFMQFAYNRTKWRYRTLSVKYTIKQFFLLLYVLKYLSLLQPEIENSSQMNSTD